MDEYGPEWAHATIHMNRDTGEIEITRKNRKDGRFQLSVKDVSAIRQRLECLRAGRVYTNPGSIPKGGPR